MPEGRGYDPTPTYPCVDGAVSSGWESLCLDLPTSGAVLAVEGPAILDWDALRHGVTRALADRGASVEFVDMSRAMVGWEQVVKRTAPVERLEHDDDFATLAAGSVRDLFDELPQPWVTADALVVVYGPGASLVDHDVLWYADLPKRYAEAAVTNGRGRNLGQPLGQPPGQPRGAVPPTTRRLLYIDWPLQDRLRDEVAPYLDTWVDLQRPEEPTWVAGSVLLASLERLTVQPFRTRPTFNTTSWGGHWAQQRLGVNPEARNTALGYELIAPESGILLGTRATAVEIPFQLLVSLHPTPVLGADVHERFGTSFPVRFDYLDTAGGGSLSVHCHPCEDDMREVFGWPYTQHETYYVMVGSEKNVVYLGLRDDASVEEFSRQAHDADDHGVPFDIEQFVQTFPAEPHQLFLIPAGTPHGSGAGNVVLEVSATPYLYSLRFYDWLRRDAEGKQRPVHVDHAFRNLNVDRRGDTVVTDLVQRPRPSGSGDGWREEILGSLPEMFFSVQRVVVEAHAVAWQSLAGRFTVLTVVEGEAATIRWPGGEHGFAFAETIVIPAAVEGYEIVANDTPVRIVKAVVP